MAVFAIVSFRATILRPKCLINDLINGTVESKATYIRTPHSRENKQDADLQSQEFWRLSELQKVLQVFQ